METELAKCRVYALPFSVYTATFISLVCLVMCVYVSTCMRGYVLLFVREWVCVCVCVRVCV